MTDNLLRVGMAQIAPVWLDKIQTLSKIQEYIKQAGIQGCHLVVFGEGLLPGYPFWLPLTQGTAWDDKMQKEIHAHYAHNAVQIEAGDLSEVCSLAKWYRIAVYLGIIERAIDRGGHSLYCSLVYINQSGEIKSVHRKLQPTYDERLTWTPGDGHGLQVHQLRKFVLGGLNCWENWMPLVRTALYGLGENLHVAVWPGAERNTVDITRFIAREARSFVVSVSGLMHVENIPIDTPYYAQIVQNAPEILANGGSCIAAPTGEWLVPPILNKEGLFTAELDINMVFEERQNFDASGHYSRPDVTQLTINRTRQTVVRVVEDIG